MSDDTAAASSGAADTGSAAPMEPMTVHDAAEKFSSLLTPKREEGAAGRDDRGRFAAQQNPAPGGDGAPAAQEQPASAEKSAEAPEPDKAPAIEPPLSWSEEDKAQFRALPAEAQRVIAARQKDMDRGFNQKAQELAEQRKAFDAERKQVAQERQQYAERLNQLSQHLDQQGKAFEQIDWDKLYQENPAEFVRQREAFRDLREAKAAAESESQRITAQQQAEAAQAHRAFLQQQHAKLIEAIPEWKDTKAYAEGAREVATYLTSHGYTPEQVGAVSDAASIQIARKAMMYDRLMADKAKVVSQVEKAPAVIKPGAPPSRQDVQDERQKAVLSRHMKERSVDSAAAAFRAMGIR
jgi:hypothetical protein